MQETSIAFQTNKTPAEYRALAELVNRYAFDVVSVYSDLPFQPSHAALLLIAPYLQRARLGPACLSPSRMSPIDMAGATALLDHLTAGRAYLGIARGAWLERHGIQELKPPLQAIREAIEIVRRLLAGTDSAYDGEVFRLEPGVRLGYPVYRENIPILIGTWGRKLAALAGELADEVKIGGCANPAMVPLMKTWIADGEKRGGRTAGSVGVVVGAVTVVDEDSRRAKDTVKRDLALYLPVIAGLDVTLHVEPELLARIEHWVRADDYPAAAALISDDILAKFAFAGSPEEILEQAQRIYDAGASRVEFGTPHGLDTATGIRLLGERVLPNLKLA
ncbi:MAG TPA: LLM class flavin-dependent oxidoreductase [Aggregatilineales bacterium]|nr:LLM class flavin-dependent oxidoreductase [Aggregatilineales bacterium]